MTRHVKASEFKAKCLALMDEVARTGQSIVITKNGRPVAELVPHKRHMRSPFGVWKGSVVVAGDIISPLDVEWEAMK
jgi:prevent-host-death family protein